MLLLYFLVTLCNVRFLHIPVETQPIKTVEQTKDYIKYVHPSFRKHNKLPSDVFCNQQDIFQIRDRNSLISSLFATHTYFYTCKNKRNVFNKQDIIKKDVIVFYSVFTHKNYRNKGYAKKLLNYSIQKMIKKCKNPLLGLHLNPEDETMNLNFALYYTLGFRKGAISEYGSECYTLRYDEIEEMKDVRKLDIINEKEKGYFLAMFCESKDFDINNKFDKELLVEGEKIRQQLLIRKKKYDSEIKNEIEDNPEV